MNFIAICTIETRVNPWIKIIYIFFVVIENNCCINLFLLRTRSETFPIDHYTTEVDRLSCNRGRQKYTNKPVVITGTQIKEGTYIPGGAHTGGTQLEPSLFLKD